MPSEQNLINRIVKAVVGKSPTKSGSNLSLGIGDDAAVIRPRGTHDWVVSCDQSLEGRHFLDGIHPPEVIGFKSLARAVSDLAAMGAVPEFFFLSLALPASKTGPWLDGFARGLSRASSEFGIGLAGGDTAQFENVCINITVTGCIKKGSAVRRSGARPGDAIFVSGQLGSAQFGLELILRSPRLRKKYPVLLHEHFYPRPRLMLGQWLVRKRFATAMMDLSDGLSSDLARMCRASGVGARIYESQVPRCGLPPEVSKLRLSNIKMALHGGDDYELLFTVRQKDVSKIPWQFHGTRISNIGTIIREKNVWLIGAAGKKSRFKPQGWDHFATKKAR
ncbi:MAG: thiamine-phosphate kinase [Acidobacteria bacterium]|nr:thiamine-phosphate kinase [Acidobacteriota bacterium]